MGPNKCHASGVTFHGWCQCWSVRPRRQQGRHLSTVSQRARPGHRARRPTGLSRCYRWSKLSPHRQPPHSSSCGSCTAQFPVAPPIHMAMPRMSSTIKTAPGQLGLACVLCCRLADVHPELAMAELVGPAGGALDALRLRCQRRQHTAGRHCPACDHTSSPSLSRVACNVLQRQSEGY